MDPRRRLSYTHVPNQLLATPHAAWLTTHGLTVSRKCQISCFCTSALVLPRAGDPHDPTSLQTSDLSVSTAHMAREPAIPGPGHPISPPTPAAPASASSCALHRTSRGAMPTRVSAQAQTNEQWRSSLWARLSPGRAQKRQQKAGRKRILQGKTGT